MNDTDTKNVAPSTPRKSASSRYWSGFSVCLFIVLLSVFTWVVQRRLAQYESVQQAGGHHLTATKVCLTDRNQVAGLSLDAVKAAFDGSAMFLVAFAVAFALAAPVAAKSACGMWRQVWQTRPVAAHSGFTFFFFLPPPSPISASQE